MTSTVTWATKISCLYLLDSFLRNTDESKHKQVCDVIFQVFEMFTKLEEPIPRRYVCRLEFLFSTWEKRLFHYHPRLIEKFREIIADPNAPRAYCSDDKFIQDTDILCKICTFLNLRQISLSSDVLKEICTQLNFVCSQSPSGSRADGISDVVDLVSKKISLLYKSCKYAEKSLTLPKCVAGPLPLSSSDVSMFLSTMENQNFMLINKSFSNFEKHSSYSNHTDVATSRIVERRIFAVDALGRNPEKNISALYTAHEHYSKQDALRFLHKDDFDDHLNLLFYNNSEKKTRLAGRICRLFYGPSREWTRKKSISVLIKHTALSEKSYNIVESITTTDDHCDEMVVPADGKFQRCPISNESFLTMWDDGELVYRDAVKVLVVPSENKGANDVYELGCALDGTIVRYLIVNKSLVLDVWMKEKKVESIKNCIERLRRDTSPAEDVVVSILSAFEEVDEVEDDVYIYKFGDYAIQHISYA